MSEKNSCSSPEMSPKAIVLSLIGNLLGLEVELGLADGRAITGLLGAARNMEGSPGVSYLLYNKKDDQNSEPESSVIVPCWGASDVSYLVTLSAAEAKPADEISKFFDSDIAAKARPSPPASGRNRELKAWAPDASDSVPESLMNWERRDKREWNQFEANQKLFGLQSTYDEELYTTKLDKNSALYKDNIEMATRVAADLEKKGKQGLTMHQREERGEMLGLEDNVPAPHNPRSGRKSRNQDREQPTRSMDTTWRRGPSTKTSPVPSPQRSPEPTPTPTPTPSPAASPAKVSTEESKSVQENPQPSPKAACEASPSAATKPTESKEPSAATSSEPSDPAPVKPEEEKPKKEKKKLNVNAPSFVPKSRQAAPATPPMAVPQMMYPPMMMTQPQPMMYPPMRYPNGAMAPPPRYGMVPMMPPMYQQPPMYIPMQPQPQ